ncbi:MAG: 16S rRNA (cytidine(1402)-2'-O)-methyltransferase, partial [Acutalibacteraceae bacterium]|nr:16S rRNA (cytidine(1402)-2'-O)-methyltransferase [Acutalibacteraceae bacterium]
PHKLNATLKDMLESFGDRKISIVRELTKIHEEVINTTLEKAVEAYKDAPLKGEIVLIIKGATIEEATEEYTLDDAVKMAQAMAEDEDISISEATKRTAKLTGIKKGVIYKAITEGDN